MVVCPEFDAGNAHKVMQRSTGKGTQLLSDGYNAYKKLKEEGMDISQLRIHPRKRLISRLLGYIRQ
jgi:primosomal replication protein N